MDINDLRRLCEEHEEESLRLEFKSCNELKPGTLMRNKKGEEITRTRDEVLDELTKDVSSFLNSAGGTIIYGIREKDSRADCLDETNAFKPHHGHNIHSERVIDWLRSHIYPPPTVDVYRVFQELGDSQSPWYLVIEIPQGLQVYMARDHRFYKRVGNIPKPMEQYEVVDVMNRTRGAALDLRIKIQNHQSYKHWDTLTLEVAVTSTNFIASEYGALKLTLAQPIRFVRSSLLSPSNFNSSTGLSLEGYDEIARAESYMMRWGANAGVVVFPEDWFDFLGNNHILIEVPGLARLLSPIYLIKAELFTTSRVSKKLLYTIQQKPLKREFEIHEVNISNQTDIIQLFWETYRKGQKFLRRLKAEARL